MLLGVNLHPVDQILESGIKTLDVLLRPTSASLDLDVEPKSGAGRCCYPILNMTCILVAWAAKDLQRGVHERFFECETLKSNAPSRMEMRSGALGAATILLPLI